MSVQHDLNHRGPVIFQSTAGYKYCRQKLWICDAVRMSNREIMAADWTENCVKPALSLSRENSTLTLLDKNWFVMFDVFCSDFVMKCCNLLSACATHFPSVCLHRNWWSPTFPRMTLTTLRVQSCFLDS